MSRLRVLALPTAAPTCLLIPPIQTVQNAKLFRCGEPDIPGFEVTSELFVIIKPPKRRRRDQEILRTSTPQCFQIANCLGAVARMVPSINSVVRLGKMPGLASFELKQCAVAFAYD